MILRGLALALAAGLMLGGAQQVAAAPILRCDAPDPALDAGPDISNGGVLPVRTDADGDQTVVTLVEDPADVADAYVYEAQVRINPDTPEERAAGVYAHPWPGAAHVVTYGTFTRNGGVIRRVPALVIENGPPVSDALGWLIANGNEQATAAGNATPYAVNTILPSSALLYSLGVGEATLQDGAYPTPVAFHDSTPVYVWSVARGTGGKAVWLGSVVMQAGRYDAAADRFGCRRIRIGSALRTEAGTTFVGGAFVEETARLGSIDGGIEAEHVVVAGVTQGAAGARTDVPLVVLHQREQRRGENLHVFASEQRDEITIGTVAAGRFVPLAGTRADATHAAPPEAESRLVSAGAYDADGRYRPVAGARLRLEKQPGELWAQEWINSGGPGTQSAGDLLFDVGTFDLDGVFLPLAGASVKDSFEGARFERQMMLKAGPWIAGEFRPVVGATYDGDANLLEWIAAADAGDFAGMKPWLASAGTFGADGRYLPVTGASFEPDSTEHHAVVEHYRLGAFAGSYDSFVPLTGATWSSDRTSLVWASQFAAAEGHPPSEARIDIGTASAGGYAHALGLVALPGRPERYQVGAWALGGFIPLLEACYSPDREGEAAAGIAVGGGDERLPVGWGGLFGGSPAAGTGDCPSR